MSMDNSTSSMGGMEMSGDCQSAVFIEAREEAETLSLDVVELVHRRRVLSLLLVAHLQQSHVRRHRLRRFLPLLRHRTRQASREGV